MRYRQLTGYRGRQVVAARGTRPAARQRHLWRVITLTGADTDQHSGGPPEEAGKRRHHCEYALSAASGALHLFAYSEGPRARGRITRVCTLGKTTHSRHNNLE